MYLKKIFAAAAGLLCATALLAGTFTGPLPPQADEITGGMKGSLRSRADRTPVSGAEIVLWQGNARIAQTNSDENGDFHFDGLADGGYEIVISAQNFLLLRVNVTVNDGYVKNLFQLSLSPLRAEIEQEQLEEFDMEDSGYQDSPTILYSQNDVFSNIAAYNFSSVRFRPRGYKSESQEVYLAGIPMNDALTGYTPFSLWSGLNEAVRSKTVTMGSEISDCGVGGYNGLTQIDGLASKVRKGWRGSVLTNSSFYRLRLMLTYASGLLDNGWSYAVSASARLGGNDWIKGVYYRSFAYYLSAEKRFGEAHRLGFAFLAAPGSRGAQNGSTQEVYDLTGDRMYNSNWGYQSGRLRNARVRRTDEPIALLKYGFTPSGKFELQATALFRFGKNGYTALDWYDAPDPRPDYYRHLPSWFYKEEPDYNRNDPVKAAWAADGWQRDVPEIAHVDWDRLCRVNRLNATEEGSRSKYVVEERRTDQRDLNLAFDFTWRPDDRTTLRGGLNGRLNRTEYFKVLDDLLGGDYYVNIDQFAERDYAAYPTMVQNDLDYFLENGAPQRLREGDKYGYDYYARVRKAQAWLSGRFEASGFEAAAGGTLGWTGFCREGLVRKGLFPGLDGQGQPMQYQGTEIAVKDGKGGYITSLGRSAQAGFLTWSAKANLAYNLKGGHRFSLNAGCFRDAPVFKQSFVSPRTRNSMVEGLKPIRTLTADLNWQYSSGGWNVRLTGYHTVIRDQSEVMSFYDDAYNSFTNFAMSGIDERHTGMELGFRLPTPLSGLAVQGVLSYGSYLYASKPRMTQTVDNSARILIENQEIPYWRSHFVSGRRQPHHVPGTPELAADLGLSWNRNYWFIDLNAEYFDKAYLSMNPLYRTDMATMGPDGQATPEEVEYMAAQEKLPAAFLLDLSVGKSWYIRRTYQLGFSLNAKNLLNNKGVITGGYEQTRLVEKTKARERYYRFDSKYFYMSGMNYMLNVYFRF